MGDRRQQLVEIFEDTQRFYRDDPKLALAVENSRQGTKLYEPDEYPPIEMLKTNRGEIEVTRWKTFEAAMNWHDAHPSDRIAVLNFASATNPGGGVKKGSSAQEESLCRCSTLYPALDQQWLWQKYYRVNRASGDNRHTDACIYSPEIIICKTDEAYPERMKSDYWVTVDVISCAAPNLRERPSNFANMDGRQAVKMTSEEQRELHMKRASHILHVAALHHEDVLILGAFGCGAFANDPDAVASAYREVLDEYRGYFKRIEFAVYCRPYETANYDAFKRILL